MTPPSTIIERIERCVALGQCDNANESSAAIRKAMNLMVMHGIEPEQLSPAALSGLSAGIDRHMKFKMPDTTFVQMLQHAQRSGARDRATRRPRYRKRL